MTTPTLPADSLSECEPCPFCGSDDVDSELWLGNDQKSGPGCMDCGATAESVDIWNNRPAQASREKLVGELCEMMDALLSDYDEEEGAIFCGGEGTCPECTCGAVPNRLNKGPCKLHRARALLARARNPEQQPK